MHMCIHTCSRRNRLNTLTSIKETEFIELKIFPKTLENTDYISECFLIFK